jgi:hypothetical protein
MNLIGNDSSRKRFLGISPISSRHLNDSHRVLDESHILIRNVASPVLAYQPLTSIRLIKEYTG